MLLSADSVSPEDFLATWLSRPPCRPCEYNGRGTPALSQWVGAHERRREANLTHSEVGLRERSNDISTEHRVTEVSQKFKQDASGRAESPSRGTTQGHTHRGWPGRRPQDPFTSAEEHPSDLNFSGFRVRSHQISKVVLFRQSEGATSINVDSLAVWVRIELVYDDTR